MIDDRLIGVRQFLQLHIESLAQLEALLLLHQSPEQLWTADSLAKALYVTSEISAALLRDLTRRGFASTAGTAHRYHMNDEESHRVIEELAKVYRERRVAVISEIYSKPLNKVQTFADAFRLRKED